MVPKMIYRIMTCFLLFALLTLTLSIAASLAQNLSEAEAERIEELITTFASDSELGMELLKDLAEENPELAALALVKLAEEIPERAVMAIMNLAEINPNVTVAGLIAIGKRSLEIPSDNWENDPKLMASLKAVITQSIAGMAEIGTGRGFGVAAIAVKTFKEIAPLLGEFLEEEAVAAGLERSYLLAASPIMP